MDGLNPYQCRQLAGPFAPRGHLTFQAAQPPEWASRDAPAGARGVIGAWSGGCADPIAKRLYFAGGGHSDGANNGVHVFDFAGDANSGGFATLEGSRSALADIVYSAPNDEYRDGRPTATHTYSLMAWDPLRRRVWRSGNARFGDGTAGTSLWAFDLDRRNWIRCSPGQVSVAGSLMLMAPDHGKMLLVNAALNQPRFVNLSTLEHTVHGTYLWGSSVDQNAVAALDTRRDRYLTVAHQNMRNLRWTHTVEVDWAANTWTATAQSLVGSDADVGRVTGGMALFYDNARDSFWCFGSRNDMTAGAIDHIQEIDAATFEVRSTPLDAALACGTYNRGMFGRFLWMPEYRTIGFVFDYNKPAAIIRLP